MNENEENRKPIQADRSAQPTSASEVVRQPVVLPVQADQVEANQKDDTRSPKRVDRPMSEEQLLAHLSKQENRPPEPMRKPIVPPQTEK